MSTATNLLSLLNQLQLMENSLTNFMLETILKIQSLTETKVFLLLESSGSGSDSVRRFCGTPDLVDSFENGRLRFKPTDVEVTLDPAVNSSIVEKPRFVISEAPQGRRKRIGGGCNDHSDATNGVSPVKRQFLSEDEALFGGNGDGGDGGDNGGGGGGGGDGLDGMTDGIEMVKREVVEFIIGDSDDEENPSDPGMSRQNSSSFISHAPSWQHDSSSNPIRENFDANQYRPSNELSARKLEALQSIENPTAVFEKGTLENKLLSR